MYHQNARLGVLTYISAQQWWCHHGISIPQHSGMTMKMTRLPWRHGNLEICCMQLHVSDLQHTHAPKARMRCPGLELCRMSQDSASIIPKELLNQPIRRRHWWTTKEGPSLSSLAERRRVHLAKRKLDVIRTRHFLRSGAAHINTWRQRSPLTRYRCLELTIQFSPLCRHPNHHQQQ
jgi:hypothetical protein